MSKAIGQPSLSVQNISKSFEYWSERTTSLKTVLTAWARGNWSRGHRERIDVLKDVSFDIYPGEFVGIMGRNGAGKSTILKLICGIYTPDKGKIAYSGTIAPLIELGAGFHPELSGHENIFLNSSVLGFGKAATLEALPEIIEFSELGEMIHMPVKHYSSGMLVRLGFSIATHLKAPILLVDEVLAVGDASFQAKSLKKIKELHEEGRTIILVTHSPDAVKEHCNRCIVISQHRKIYDGPSGPGSQVYLENVELRDDSLSTPVA